ncbi:molybdopterin-dependent oxidoreductase [Bosea sp. AS-1]|uniref:molybdopterin-containing oxidoreductase family protein n=1 Tax=Bosea sp. AS-1 TaxID=2015316 RepID=UPI000B771EEF|nr:molybdopterin-dependent oxidoreductase [Bosea sp. AS-1]
MGTGAKAQGDQGSCLELPPENAEVFNATCQYCMVQCGYKVHVWEQGTGIKPEGSYTGALSGEWYSPSFVIPAEKNGKQVFIAAIPDKDCVVNAGDYSIRGGTNAETLFSKNLPTAHRRLLHPMIRKGGKGSPLTQVSWDEAIDFVVTNLGRIRDEHGPDALSLVWGDWLYNLHTYAMLKLWFTGIGSSTHAGNGWFYDEESAGISAAFGTGTRSFTEEDFELTKLLVTVGTNIEANGSVWYLRFYQNNMSGGSAKHIEIDPRRTYQARLAEEHGGLHLQVRPGSDAILLGAIIREIINRGGYDKEFVAEYVNGFDGLRETVADAKFELAAAARETWVPADKIQRAVDMLIEARGKTMMLNEKGIMHQMAAFEAQHALAALGAILGNVGKPGACTSRAGGHPGGSLVWPPEPPSRKDNNYMYKRLAAGGIKATWAFGCNIAKQLPSLTKYLPMIKETFVIVQDRAHTDMDEFADVLLPAATWGENDTLLTSVTRRLRMTQQFMNPPAEARPDWWIVSQIAKRMGYSGYDWQTPKDVWDEMRVQSGDVKDITWEMLLKAGTNGVRFPYINGKAPERFFSDEYAQLTGKRFPTSDGKVHLEKTVVLKDFRVGQYEWQEISGDYPLMAIDFRLNELWNTGYTYWEKPTVSARTPDAYIQIHPEDAKARGIAEGEMVEIRSPYGKCRGVARVTEDIIKGVVGIPALFPKAGQEFNFATRPHVSPVNGDFDTMVACDVAKG